ncbi:hypothetical protein ACNTMW_32005 [Planosporangium sp. 12N6]|uniref:hypothetical protein n=1 Tax=Planosporangium spinosum TaxID=3402278 RepID=UPI003CF86C96
MSPTTAFAIVTWAAIIVLFAGLAAVLREVRALRDIVTRTPDGFAATQPDLALGARFATGDQRVVLAADSGCPLCLQIVDRLARQATAPTPGPLTVTLLTHEPPATWDGLADGMPVVSDRDSWRAVSHLAPPVLMLVDGSGTVRRMSLPVRADEVDGVLREWSDPVVT